jgi:hypothetical protein
VFLKGVLSILFVVPLLMAGLLVAGVLAFAFETLDGEGVEEETTEEC